MTYKQINSLKFAFLKIVSVNQNMPPSISYFVL